MKVIAFLDNDITVGGGFNQALNAILQMSRICEGRFDFEVMTSVPENIEKLKQIGVAHTFYKTSIYEKIISRFISLSFIRRMQDRINKRWIYPIEKTLLRNKADLVYFLGPSPIPLFFRKLNYIYTIWDLCHRDYPEFPEVSNYGIFEKREHLHQRVLPPSYLTLTDSALLAENISQRYGIERTKLIPMPFSPALFLNSGLSKDKANTLQQYSLDEGYLFYPAQFWAHKNHIRILEALVILKERGRRPKVVFAGGDQGNKAHVESFVDKYGLREQVRFLGFVPTEHLRGLYEGCQAVVMPTYFGPTNIPPLEAWMIGKPLIYSAHLKEQVGEAALCVNVDDAKELAEAIELSSSPVVCSNLVKAGNVRLREIELERVNFEAEFLDRLLQFEARRRCWA